MAIPSLRLLHIRLPWMFLYRFYMRIWDFCLLFFISLPYVTSMLMFNCSSTIWNTDFLSALNCLCKVSCPYMCVCVWIFFSIPLIYLSIFMSIQLCVGYCNFIKVLKSGSVSLSLFKIVLITLDPLRFPVNLGISLSISTQKPVRIWQRLHWLCTSVEGELIL